MYYKLVKNDKGVSDGNLQKIDDSSVGFGEVLNRGVLRASEGICSSGLELKGVFKQKEDTLGTDVYFCRFYLTRVKVQIEVSFEVLKIDEPMKYDRDFFDSADSNSDIESFFKCYLLMKLQKFCLCWCCDSPEVFGYTIVNGCYRL